MALLDIFREVLQETLGIIFVPGKIWHPSQTDDGKGGYTTGVATSQDCEALIGDVTEYMKKEAGYTDKDVGLFVLQGPGLTLNDHDEVEIDGKTFSLGIIKSDPAQAAWEVRGTPKRG